MDYATCAARVTTHRTTSKIMNIEFRYHRMPRTQDNQADSRWFWLLSNGVVAVFAFLLTWVCGHRGLFLQDQSMVFDGAWRLLQGQVPYRDVLFPFGPITFVIQALFFKVFGVNFSATVLSAAVLNVSAALLVKRIVRVLFQGQEVTALIAGIVTACWFQAPFGTLWLEQTAFFFGLVALLFALQASRTSRPGAPWLHALAGLMLALSVLSKQNAGLLFFPILAGTVVVSRLRDGRAILKGLTAQLSGFLIGIGGFVLWLCLFSNPWQYFHYSIEISRSIAIARAPENPVLFLAGFVTFSAYAPSIKWCALFFAIPGFVALFTGLFQWAESESQCRDYAVAGWIIVSCLEFQQLFITTTFNEAANGVPFFGLIGGLSFGLLSVMVGKKGVQFSMISDETSVRAAISSWTSRALLCSTSILLCTALIAQGIRTSWNRSVQQFPTGSHFTESLNVDRLHRLKWADCSYSGRLALSTGVSVADPNREWWIRKSDFQNLNEWLVRNPGNFFVFGDSTMLYGLHQRPSPQPWLYFQRGHSYLDSDLPYVDEVVVASLTRTTVRAVILEKISWAGQQDTSWLPHMPKLQKWINSNFTKEKEFGIYEVWVAKSS